MSKRMNIARTGAAVVGVGAIVAASVIPGTIAVAEETGDVNSVVTRAVQALGDANGEISRAILVTQINLDGNGTANFTVPVAEGSSPKNMDSFGGPEVVDGSAQYNVTVDGPQTFRTSQDYSADDIPVTVGVSATLDGQPISPTDLAGKSGLAKLTYSFENTTSEPTQVTYKDAKGQTITKELEIPVPMGASLVMEFGPSWQELSAPKADAVIGNGTGAVQVQGSVALLPDSLPGQSTSGTFEIEGRITDAVVPAADIKVPVLKPDEFPAIQSSVASAEQLSDLTAQLTEAGLTFEDGGKQLNEGLTQASEGANKLNDAVAGQLGPGVAQLSEGLNTFNDVAIATLTESAADLPASVTSSPDFAQITDGFDALRSAADGVREGLGVYKSKSSQKPGSWLKKNGEVDTGRADVARTLWSLVYGTRQKDIPSDSKNPRTLPGEDNGGLTNPDCNIDKPQDPANPCGAWQVANALKGGLEQAGSTLANQKDGGAFAFTSLSKALGCTVIQPGDPGSVKGQTGPIVPATILSKGQFGCTKPITVGGQGTCPSPLGTLPCNLVVGAVLGGYDVGTGLNDGLTQSFYKPLNLEDTSQSGLTALLGLYMPAAISAILENVTTSPTGIPDRDTSKANTATGIVFQTRASLAQGGTGSDGYPAGRCEGYAKTGDPKSGINKDADPDRVKETCAAGDVLQIDVYGVDALEEGVSVTLLEGISETLLEGVGTYFVGCNPTSTLACAAGTLAAGGDQLNEGVNLKPGENLVYGINALAEGLPAAVDGTAQIEAGGGELAGKTNDGNAQANEALSVIEAMQSRVNSGAGIPGGAPVGVDTFNGVYAFAFDGAGGTATENAARAGLGFLGLIAAGGIGALLANRAGG